MNKELKSKTRAKKYVEEKYKKSFTDHEADQMFLIGQKLKGNGGPMVNREYTEKEWLSLALHNMYELTIEFFDEIKEDEFYDFDTRIED